MPDRLLRKNISPLQIAGYIAANLLGLIIVGLAIQLHADLRPASGGSDPLNGDNFIILTHNSGKGLFGNSPESFSEQEISAISARPWATDVAPLVPSRFDATIGVDFGGNGFSTDIFFEGIPQRILDLPSDSWTFSPENPEVAIILPRDYLALYNFGFAPTRGLPSLDEKTLRMIPLRVTLTGNGKAMTLPGRIAGFSSRITTIGAPESFVAWANREFGGTDENSPIRLAVNSPLVSRNQALKEIDELGLSVNGNDGQSERLGNFLNIAATIIIAVGALICILSLGILLLSLSLLIQKTRKTLADLIFIGYTPNALSRFYIKTVAIINAAILLLASAAIAIGASLWQPRLASAGFTPSSILPTIAILAAIVLAVTALNSLQIKRHISRIKS